MQGNENAGVQFTRRPTELGKTGFFQRRGSRSGPEGGSALVASSHREAPACCSCSEQRGVLASCRVWLLSHSTKPGVLSLVSHTLHLPASACCYRDNGGQETARAHSLSWPRGHVSFYPCASKTQKCWTQHKESGRSGDEGFRRRPRPEDPQPSQILFPFLMCVNVFSADISVPGHLSTWCLEVRKRYQTLWNWSHHVGTRNGTWVFSQSNQSS
ncbi:uncharacterized protein LOC132651500 [Meriones unguiculatus]|uniref:uncharacterized protein LOC132651500 n=1 Tax=Meriones unguiculatus TaxID=10047 RepID=UPI00293E5888|nr:uncharacterized protein LOC132651500 [Meriones unguiculatus]